uniref:ADAM metallopeptidase domain 9 n=1 Tax=Phasianus colchicus TaxID=9054 RepID=A0A669QI52_PHACC
MLPTLVPNAEPLPGFSGASRVIYSEVMVPRQLELRHGADDVAYLITAEGSYHVLHLTRAKNLVAKDLPVYTYGAKGELITEFPYIQDDCFYEGFVEGSPGSIVALSTCYGIRGILQMGDLQYEVQPVQNSSTFQHLIYRTEPAEGWVPPCQLPVGHPAKDGDHTNGSREILSIEVRPLCLLGSASHRVQYLQDPHPQPQPITATKSCSSVPHLHGAQSLNVNLCDPQSLSATSLWSTVPQCHISMVHSPSVPHLQGRCPHHLLGSLCQCPTPHLEKSSQLAQISHCWKPGSEHLRTPCSRRHGLVFVLLQFSGQDTVQNAMTLAHMIGHSLGFNHDDRKQFQYKSCDCNCTQRGCIMGSYPGSCLAFSNCTLKEYYEEVIRKNKPCLLNIPPLKPSLFELCGNGVLERGEECDCGSDKACLKEGCCFSNCMLAPGASCYRGECCRKCRFQPAGKICRAYQSECDLPEYCNGKSASCPVDVFKQDGTPCGNNDRCYEGQCHSHEAQCKALFGKAAHRAPLSCFRDVNLRGDRSGNCGWNGTHYTKCLEGNILCGRVQCTNIKRVPVRQDGETVVQTFLSNQLCWGLEFHLPFDTPDDGSVKDGTSCGTNKICINRTCVSAAFLSSICTAKKCHGRGVCNNKNNCHCDSGWAPPDCRAEGFGGSVDSGPPPSYYGEQSAGCGATTLHITPPLSMVFS